MIRVLGFLVILTSAAAAEQTSQPTETTSCTSCTARHNAMKKFQDTGSDDPVPAEAPKAQEENIGEPLPASRPAS